LKPGDLYEDCAFHPCRCTSVEDEGESILGVSLLDGTGPRGCSWFHCGVVVLTQEEADKLLDVWRTEGERGVLIYRGWGTPEEVDEYLKGESCQQNA